MTTEKVVKWLQSGYPYFKEESELPAWVVPEHCFDRMADELGDESILELSQPLGFADGIEEMVDKAPDPETVPPEAWQTAIKLWPAHFQVRPVVDVCLDAAGRILRQFESGRLKVDPAVVCRGIAVLGCAPFVPRGKRLIEELATVLGGSPGEPAGLVKRYAEAVIQGDTETVRRVDSCIAKRNSWVEWARILLQQMRDFPYSLKPVGVTPPLSVELIGVLTQMMKEEHDDEPGRDHPEHPAGQICAQ